MCIRPSYKLLAIVFYSLLTSTAAIADADFRVVSAINQDQQLVDYQLTLTDCQLVEKFEVTAGTFSETKVATVDDQNRCRFQFTAKGNNYLAPSVQITFKTGMVETHSETFTAESLPPTINLNSVNVIFIDGQQYLAVSASATDDVDISYLAFSIVGLRASDLRAANG